MCQYSPKWSIDPPRIKLLKTAWGPKRARNKVDEGGAVSWWFLFSFFFFLFLSHRLQQFPTQRKLLMPLAAKKDSKKHHCNHHQSTDDLNSLVVHIPKFTLSTTHFGDPKNQRNHFQNAHSWHSCHFHNPQNDSETSGKQNKMIKFFKLLGKTLFFYRKVAMISSQNKGH